MALPNVRINFMNGQLGAVGAMDDGCTGLISGGVAVSDKIYLNTPFLVTSLKELEDRGVSPREDDDNAYLHIHVKGFYAEAPVGTKLWVMVVSKSTTIERMVDKTNAFGARKLLEAAQGEIRTLMVAPVDATGYDPEFEGGLDAKVYAAITNAQLLGEYAAETMYAPILTIIPGRWYTGDPTELSDLGTGGDNRVAVVIGMNIYNAVEAAVGLVAGRIAAIPVQRSIARVRDGSIAATKMYIETVPAELGQPEAISDKGFICPRTFVGKSGYFWSDDKLATAPEDDYALIPRRRTIDKAYRIAYRTLVEELNNEVPVTDEGKIAAPYAKSVQAAVESAIINQMTSVGNLGVDASDPNDMGVECYVNPDQNIVATSRLDVELRVKPYGYAKYITVDLGFKVSR